MNSLRVGALGWVVFAVAVGCSSPRAAVSGQPARAPTDSSPLRVESDAAGAAYVHVERAGDPSGAVAVVLWADDPFQAAALGAVVEARIRAHGGDVVVDRHSVRGRFFVESGSANQALERLRAAIWTPVSDGSNEQKLAQARIVALRSEVLDDAGLVDIAECALRRGPLPGTAFPDVTNAGGASLLESWRRAAVSKTRLAFASVGGEALRREASTAMSVWPKWPSGASISSPSPQNDTLVYGSPSLQRGTVRLSVAIRGDAARTVALAQRAGSQTDPLAKKLAQLASPFRITSAGSWATPAQDCALIEAESTISSQNSDIEATAGVAVGLIEAAFASTASSRLDPHPHLLRGIQDPRDAAGAAGWWALTRHAASTERVSVALGEWVPTKTTDESTSFSQQSARLRTSLARVRGALSQSAIELRSSTELGQGELWALAATPCPLAERASEVGLSATLLLSQLAANDTDDGVELEPWIQPDGVGYLAHARPRDGEPSDALARRVSNALARVLLVTPPSRFDHESTLLSLVDRAASPAVQKQFLLATWLMPQWPSRLTPLGSTDSQARAVYGAVVSRFQALASGPLRLAVIAPMSSDQPAILQQTLDTFVTKTGEPRVCVPVAQELPTEAGNHGWPFASTTVALRLDATDPTLADLTAEMLIAPESPVRKSLPSSLSITSQRSDVGPYRTVVLSMNGPATDIDIGIAKLKEGLTTLANGGASEDELSAAWVRWTEARRISNAKLSSRVADLWRGTRAASKPTLDALRTWQKSSVRVDQLVVAQPYAPPSSP
ncbi:MAG: hypothetical protein U0165_08445 [Polyangiaceae bacterium]